MKRLFSIILSVAIVSVFTACKDDYDGWLPDNPDKPYTTETISTKKASTTTSTSGQIDFYIGDTRFNSIYTYLRY